MFYHNVLPAPVVLISISPFFTQATDGDVNEAVSFLLTYMGDIVRGTGLPPIPPPTGAADGPSGDGPPQFPPLSMLNASTATPPPSRPKAEDIPVPEGALPSLLPMVGLIACISCSFWLNSAQRLLANNYLNHATLDVFCHKPYSRGYIANCII